MFNRSSTSRLTPALLATAALAAASTAFAAAPERTESGNTLQVASEHAARGIVYHVHAGKDAQATFTSDAPLEHIKGTSNRLVGYATWDPSTTKLVAGEFLLPVASLDTGIPMRDEHLQGSRWLDAEAHPDLHFSVSDSKNVTKGKSTDAFTTYELTLVGDMTIKGVTKTIEVPARITLMPESDATRSRFPGDLMAIRATYDIVLADFGVTDQVIQMGKVADVVTIENVLFMSTVSPDDARRNR
ncbi:MAG: YceI family protein [Planctomycetota bacterium]|nr:YceI family protein [Planctomycetota bacterium]